MSRLVLSSIRSQRSAVPNYRGGCVDTLQYAATRSLEH